VPIPRAEINPSFHDGGTGIYATGYVAVSLGARQSWPGCQFPEQFAIHSVQAIHISIEAAENDTVVADGWRAFDIGLTLESPEKFAALSVQAIQLAIVVANVEPTGTDTGIADKAIFARFRLFPGREAPAQPQRGCQRSLCDGLVIRGFADHLPATTTANFGQGGLWQWTGNSLVLAKH
jgi:hypothetical protein